MEACDSMEKGVITMYNKIISGINSEYDILLEESDIDSILQGNTEFYEEAVVRMTELFNAEVSIYTDDCGEIQFHCLNDCLGGGAWLNIEY